MSRLTIDLVAERADASNRVIIVSGADVAVFYRNNDGTAGSGAPVYLNALVTDATVISQPFATNSDGTIPGWLDPGDYIVQITAGADTATHPFTNPGRFTARGVWDSGTTYAVNDFVAFTDGSTYVSTVNANLNLSPPTNPGQWQLMAESGTISGPAGGALIGTYPNPTLGTSVVTDANIVSANKDGTTSTPSLRTLGAGATQAVAGNDSRLSDVRIPTGAAGGDLSGTYPNPAVSTRLRPTSRSGIYSASPWDFVIAASGGAVVLPNAPANGVQVGVTSGPTTVQLVGGSTDHIYRGGTTTTSTALIATGTLVLTYDAASSLWRVITDIGTPTIVGSDMARAYRNTTVTMSGGGWWLLGLDSPSWDDTGRWGTLPSGYTNTVTGGFAYIPSATPCRLLVHADLNANYALALGIARWTPGGGWTVPYRSLAADVNSLSRFTASSLNISTVIDIPSGGGALAYAFQANDSTLFGSFDPMHNYMDVMRVH